MPDGEHHHAWTEPLEVAHGAITPARRWAWSSSATTGTRTSISAPFSSTPTWSSRIGTTASSAPTSWSPRARPTTIPSHRGGGPLRHRGGYPGRPERPAAIPVAHGVEGSFREFMLFLHNNNPVEGRFAARRRHHQPARRALAPARRSLGTSTAHRFSSVTHGDPHTPTVRAYVGDPVVVRGMGLVERVGGVRFTGHRLEPAGALERPSSDTSRRHLHRYLGALRRCPWRAAPAAPAATPGTTSTTAPWAGSSSPGPGASSASTTRRRRISSPCRIVRRRPPAAASPTSGSPARRRPTPPAPAIPVRRMPPPDATTSWWRTRRSSTTTMVPAT